MSNTLDNPNREKALELKVGIFVLFGLVFIAVMAFKFGRVGQGLFQKYYPVTVLFPNASGLIKNSDVQLAGARIGYVTEKPVIAPSGSGVIIHLDILSGIAIPRKSNFIVSSSGLLGDKFVEVRPAADFNPATFDRADPKQAIVENDTVQGGTDASGLEALQNKGAEVFDQLKIEIQKLLEITDKINNGVLSETNQKNINATFENLKGTSEHFNVASKDLDVVVQNAKGVVDSANKTLGTVNGAAADVRTTLAGAQKTIDSAKALLARAQTGPGLIATLLNDKKLSADLQSFAANLRQRGVLFYKNSPAPASATPTPRPVR